MIGDKVTIKRVALTEDQQIYPHGEIIEIVDDHTGVVELDFLEERVKVDIKYIVPQKSKNNRSRKN